MMNAKTWLACSTLLALAACTSPAPKPPAAPEVVRVPVSVPCVTEVPEKPVACAADGKGRVEYLRCVLVNYQSALVYQEQLRAVLSGCKQ